MLDDPGPRQPTTRRRWARIVAVVVAGAVVASIAFVGLQYRHQITSYVTHRKGSPTHTEAYVPFPADDPPAVRIAVVGDIGDSGKRIEATGAAVDAIAGERPFDYLLLLGDNVYPAGDPAQLPDTIFGPFSATLDRGTELLAISGNHDEPREDEQLAALGMPGLWWSVERGPLLLIGLDSNHPDDPEQLAFLEDQLRTTTARWKVVALHHPPYSAGYQGSNQAARAAFTPLFERYGVQLVLSGHDHDYQRSVPIEGVTYVVSGAAAGTRRTAEADFTAVSFSWHSFVELGVYDDRIVGRVLNQDDRVADEWVLRASDALS